MTISELIAELTKVQASHGDLKILNVDPNEGYVSDVDEVIVAVAEDEQYPVLWNMPAGFKFVEIR